MNMSDIELLELAAKAAGIEGYYIPGDELFSEGIYLTDENDCGYTWSPLDNDADALRLAVQLHMDILQYGEEGFVSACYKFDEPYNGDPVVATRRAIVRAAAAMVEGARE